MDESTSDQPILELRDVEKHFDQQTGLRSILSRSSKKIRAVDGVSLEVEQGDVEGIIGESGCGKSTLLNLLIGLHTPTGGDIYYRGHPMSEFSKQDWKEYRRNVQIIFQDPFNSLNPKMSVREAVREPLDIHNFDNKEQRVQDALEKAQLSPPEHYLDSRPGQLSGGEKQRVSIARSLVVEPDILLADEPVSMLDVSTQASILNLLTDLTTELGVTMVYVSHDLSTVGYLCDRVNVMYLGRIVESGPTRTLIEEPMHPYSDALVNAIPVPDPFHDRTRTEMKGSPMDPAKIGDGCRFRDRCPDEMEICKRKPLFLEVEEGRQTACHLHYDHEQHEHGAAEPSVPMTDGDGAGDSP